MKRPAFSEGILVAIGISVMVTALFTVMSAFFPTRWLLQILIATVSFTYVVYLLMRSTEPSGRLTIISTWATVSILVWMFSPSIMVTLFVHVGLIWLVRALYFYSSAAIALIDLGLSLFAMSASIWTLSYTDSLFLSVWCFFLLQGLFVFLPTDLSKKHPTNRTGTNKPPQPDKKDSFEQAYQSAQTALRRVRPG